MAERKALKRFGLWGWTAACLVFSLRLFPWGALQDAAFPLAKALAARPTSPLPGLLKMALLLLAVWLPGEALLKRWLKDSTLLGRWPQAFGAGLVLHTLLLCGLAAFGLMRPAAVRWLLALTAALGLIATLPWRRPDIEPSRPDGENLAGWVVFAFLLLGPNLLAALSPVVFYDSAVYHYALPEQFLRAGSFTRMPFTHFAAFPMGWDILNALTLAWGYGFPQKALLWGACAAAAGALAQASGSWVPGLLFLSMPALAINLASGGTELGWAFFLVLGWVCLLKEDERWRTLGCVFCAAALSTKYLAALPWAATGFFFWLFKRPKRFAALYLGAGAALLAPWLVRNLLHYGNPVHPFFSGELMSAILADASGSRADLLHPSSWLAWLGPLRPYLGTTVDMDFAGAGVLWALPFLRPSERSRPLLWTLAFCWLGWGLSTGIVRFLLPTLALLFLALRDCRVDLRLPAAALAFFNGLLGLDFTARTEGWKPALGVETLPVYLSRDHASWFNPCTPIIPDLLSQPPGKVLLVGDARSLYLPGRIVSGTVFQAQPLTLWAEEAGTAEGLRERLRKEGIDYLVLNLAEAMRLQRMRPILSFSEKGEAAFKEFWDAYVELAGERVRTKEDGMYALFLYRLRDTPREAGEKAPENHVLGLLRHQASLSHGSPGTSAP
ncbi:MAG TPA: hypothetical protein DCM05_13305 [Elusimicrobia bacterium]|nr:hypothetical protein [Elusimicrobiota bacterium]